MADSPLLPSHKKALADAIEQSGIPLDEFQTVQVDGEWVGLLESTTPAFHHTSTGFTWAYFYMPDFHDSTFGQRIKGGYACSFTPGRGTPSEQRRHLTWDEALNAFITWLELIKREVHSWHPGKYPPATSQPAIAEYAPPTAPPPAPVDPPAPSPTVAVVAPQAWGLTVNDWLEGEAKKRGRLWLVIGAIITIVLTAITLF